MIVNLYCSERGWKGGQEVGREGGRAGGWRVEGCSGGLQLGVLITDLCISFRIYLTSEVCEINGRGAGNNITES